MRAWQPTPVFLPGESHGLRSLGVYSPWGREELDLTKVTEHATCILITMYTNKVGKYFSLLDGDEHMNFL